MTPVRESAGSAVRPLRVTVAICTWNRADSLRRTLASIAWLRVPQADVSIVIVDNNSTDHTPEVIAAARLPFAITRLFEAKSGLSNARNAAVAHVHEEGRDILVFTDDDVEVEPEWLSAYVTAFREHPSAVVFGGPVTPVFEREPPDWMRRNMSALRGPFVYVDHGSVDRQLDGEGDMPFGANMAYRVSALSEAPFDPALGVAPGRRMGGEETDLSRRLLLRDGQRWVYVAGARVRHHLPGKAVQPSYLFMHLRSTGQLTALQDTTPVRSRLWPRSLPPRWLLRQYATTWMLRRWCWLTRNRSDAYARHFSHEALLRGQLDMYTRPGAAGGQYAR